MSRRPIDFDAIAERVSPLEVLGWSGWKGYREASGWHRGKCPFHQSGNPRSRSFAAGYKDCKCYKCDWYGNSVKLYAYLHNLRPYEAAIALCQRVSMAVPYIDRPKAPTH